MEQCHRFLHSWQDTELVPCTDFLKMKYLDTHASKQLEIISWFHTNDISVHSLDPRFTRLPVANIVLKRTCDIRVASRNLVCGDETHLTLQKSDPIDSDCPGHPTHLQPCQAHMTVTCSSYVARVY